MDIIRPAEGDAFAVYDGRPVDQREWELTRVQGLGINVVGPPPGQHGLDALSPAFDWLETLRINSSECRDLSAVSLMTRLKVLAVGGEVEVGVEASRLPALESFGGPYESFPGIQDLDSLRNLAVTWNTNLAPLVKAPIVHLAVTEKARVCGLPRLSSPDSLSSLAVYFAKSLSLDSISSFNNLKSLTLHGCRHITAADQLLELSLESLVLENCPLIERYELLTAVNANMVRVIGRNPFGAEFRAEVGRIHEDVWIFPPGARFLPSTF